VGAGVAFSFWKIAERLRKDNGMPSATFTKIVKQDDGSIRFRFGKREYEFASLVAVREFVRRRLDQETIESLALALLVSRQPSLANLAAIEGRTVVVDFSLANWGTIK
jgi:hypothetical protein